uniref:Innexin n=1 Tax=Trichuris muris TaxID=70415 RepID=A0A5S6QMQ5_TRIMR
MLPFLDSALRAIHKQSYDDFVDRLNYYYTTLILLFLAILVSAKQYVGQPIQCWVPAQFRGGWEQYAENYCFVQNTYFLPFDKDVPREIVERDYRKIGYYQWVPIVLAIQALLFYMPNMVWKLLNWQSGINVKAVLEMANGAHLFEADRRECTIKQLCRYLEDTLALQANLRNRTFRVLCLRMSRNQGNYLTCLYNFIKFLYLVNVCGQFFLMNAFLSTSYSFWGLQIMADLANGREWPNSGHFPRVTLCDFDIRELGNIHRHTVQCVLMINMFNEKIYLFLWFWMFLVGAATAGNLLYWMFSSMSSGFRESLIQNHLRITTEFDDILSEKRLTQRFVQHALLPDGVLLLRFIQNHAGDMTTTEVVAKLFKDFVDRNHLSDATDPKKAHVRDSPSYSGRDLDHGFYDTEKCPSDGTNGSMSAPLLPSAPKLSDQNTLKAGDTRGYPGPPAVPPKPKEI